MSSLNCSEPPDSALNHKDDWGCVWKLQWSATVLQRFITFLCQELNLILVRSIIDLDYSFLALVAF